MWDPSIFKLSNVAKFQNALIVSGFLCGDASPINIANIYAPQTLKEKIKIWDLLGNLCETNVGMWVILGDFNEVSFPSDRKNSEFNKRGAMFFNNFIEEAKLMEYSMGGYKYTFSLEDGSKMSKIDRILVCSTFMDRWPNATLMALPKKWSDHHPLSLNVKKKDFGPKPFKFHLLVVKEWL